MPATLTQKERVQKYFKEASDEWGDRYRRTPARMSDLDLQLRRENVALLLEPLTQNPTSSPLALLDIGCGAGNLLDALPQSVFDVTGIDVVEEMVAAASHYYPNARFFVADAATIPLEDHSFDVVTCLGVLEYFPDPSLVVGEMARLLKPGGHLIVSFPNKKSLFRLFSRWEIGLECRAVNLIRRLRGRRRDSLKQSPYHHTQWSLQQAQELLRRYGFEVSNMRFNTFGLWGKLGRLSLSLTLSCWMSRWFGHNNILSSTLACTAVISAQRNA